MAHNSGHLPMQMQQGLGTGHCSWGMGDGWDTADRRHLPPPVLSKCQPHSLVFHYDSAIGGHTWTGKYLQELSNASPMWSQLRIEIQIQACEREKWVSKEALTSLHTLTLRTNVQVQGDFITNEFWLPLYFKNYKKRQKNSCKAQKRYEQKCNHSYDKHLYDT